jgi:hypothetical protein
MKGSQKLDTKPNGMTSVLRCLTVSGSQLPELVLLSRMYIFTLHLSGSTAFGKKNVLSAPSAGERDQWISHISDSSSKGKRAV